MIDNLKILSFI